MMKKVQKASQQFQDDWTLNLNKLIFLLKSCNFELNMKNQLQVLIFYSSKLYL